ncbi:hypothetical protein EMIHUDRAFT_235566 [Emiliania huxleyi CCMP1516]|uniref:C3H1-type domain-containing protein n=2 Tax=Emiliania huxleyi TaxID=2903 RepID=A0A0D3JVN9_EMIH1|nr:hypothetical protein EMIHUDRAFT_235566 [Emiliania huxleyi CCMP1516]EOD27574.1 hypothetical protein EMIHUDRAFT_235566 [Emiliania huxleyi CCMP1516]|eukprot:XP_005780003.1 hypothetical protein EMIHUDRAFT_235566 [Emiliania huxleyi CCMP1516]
MAQADPVSWQSLAHSGKLSRALDKEDPATPWIKKLRVRNLEPSPEPYTLRIAMPCTCGGCIAAHEMKPERGGATKKGLVMVWDETKQTCKLEADQLSAVVAAAALAPASSAAASSEEPPPPVGSTTSEVAGPPEEEEAAEPAAPPLQREAEGLRLHLSSSSGTGYQSVYKLPSGRFALSPSRPLAAQSPRLFLGSFGTAVEAAAAYARAVGEPPAASVFEGMRLHLSSSSSTGYEGVHRHASGKFVATRYEHGRVVHEEAEGGPASQMHSSRKNKPQRCSVCGGIGHKSRTCQQAVVDGAFFDVTVPADLPASRKVHVAMPATPPRPPQALARTAEAPLATEAEGLQLHLSSSNSTGYKNVYKEGSRFKAQDRRDRKTAPLAAEAEGLRLHVSSRSNNSTGYTGVFRQSNSRRFEAKHMVDGKTEQLLGCLQQFVQQAGEELKSLVTSLRELLDSAEPSSRLGTLLCNSRAYQGDEATQPADASRRTAWFKSTRVGSGASWSFEPLGLDRARPCDSAEILLEARQRVGPECERVLAGISPPSLLARATARTPAPLVTEAEGMRLYLSSNGTGYRGVRKDSGRFQARHRVDGRRDSLGTFDTAVEAAVAYARAVSEAPAQGSAAAGSEALGSDEGEGEDEEGEARCLWGRLGAQQPSAAWAADPPHKRVRTAKRPYEPPEGPPPKHRSAAAPPSVPTRRLTDAELVGLPAGLCGQYQQGLCHKGGKCKWRHELWPGLQERLRTAKRPLEPFEGPPPKRRSDAARAFGCILPAGHGGPHDFTLPAKRARCEKRPSEAEAGRKTWFCTLHAPAVVVVAEAEGMRLHLSSSSSTGYRGVSKNSGGFRAQRKVDDRPRHIGTFGTAVEAAVAYARAEAPPDNGGMAAVAEALGRIGLQSYAAAFDSEGYDDIEFLLGLDSAERAAVATATGMDAKPGHAGKWVKFGFGEP